ncbi:LysR substrate-binding domain-containing protein [Paraburkholderia sp. SARCC-3016]|uniref:LysR family transcriptional regulator n=1 Tax=Paraburkholderia sp. SARCC-3016 TaxID=3058611 RepID=UPI002809E7BA|nr:LysR substrate-binding domain-containing protein [Paraburkholderia sp. SARCC-3016]MDQ7979895.1 LysR substrate-binding domain-containing protein [Paraburkholderia sp. SARCC-3016]
MKHEHLRILLEVARHGAFSTVARQRNVDPSSISRIVQGAERELGVRLFQRSTRRVVVTEAGDAYLSHVSRLLEELDSASDAVREFGKQPKGTLRLTASVAFGQSCVVPLLPEFLARYPDIRLELLLADANVDMVAERIDLAVRLSSRMGNDLVRVKWFDTRYRICATPDYLRQKGAINSPDDLDSHPCVLFGLPNPQSQWRVTDRSGHVHYVAATSAATVSNGLAQRELAIAGVGPALMPAWLVADEIAAGRLVEVLPGHEVVPADFDGAAWLLYPSRAYLPAKTRAMVDFLLENAKKDWGTSDIARRRRKMRRKS